MSVTLEALVLGVGFWSPQLPSWETARDVLRGTTDPPAEPAPRVAPSLLAPTERRRAPDTVAIGIEVAARACAMAGRDPRSLASVFASSHGDLPINDYMCATLATAPRQLSPTRFHNSVHNAVSGYWTIGTGCMKPSTAISAWDCSFGAGLLESLVQVATEREAVIFVAYDVASRGPLATVTASEGMLAAALVLGPVDADSQVALARLCCRVSEGQPAAAVAALPRRWETLLPANAMRPCLPLFAALAGDSPARLTFGVGSGTVLDVAIEVECPSKRSDA